MRTDEFEALYRAHAEPLFGFLLYRTGGDQALSEDLMADTFERALRARRRFDRRKASEKTWLYSIAMNVMRDHARRRAAEARAHERAGPAEAETGLSEDALADRDAIMRAMSELPVEEREALALRFGADMTVPEVAKLTGQPLSRAEGRVYRGLRRLREQLGG